MFWAKKKTCDWCGSSFKGAGVEAGGIVFCGTPCQQAHDAPANLDAPSVSRQRGRKKGHGERVVTIAAVRDDLRAADEHISESLASFYEGRGAIADDKREDLAGAATHSWQQAWMCLRAAFDTLGEVVRSNGVESDSWASFQAKTDGGELLLAMMSTSPIGVKDKLVGFSWAGSRGRPSLNVGGTGYHFDKEAYEPYAVYAAALQDAADAVAQALAE